MVLEEFDEKDGHNEIWLQTRISWQIWAQFEAL